MNYHLLVLVHGLWGNKGHFEYINQELDAVRANLQVDEELIIYRTSDNEGYKTLDGIDVCGLRVAKEIKDQINLLNEVGNVENNDEKAHVTKLSVVGYSLGGLISRYAIGILYHQGYFDTIEPVNFTTICTPHVGVLMPGMNISVRFFNWLVPNLLSQSGKQMFLKDSSGPRDMPLLSLMADPTSVFYKALQSFKYRNLYANAINDKRTSWWTAGISMVDPFMKIDETSSLNELDFKFVDGYSPIVIDSDAPFVISTRPIEKVASPLMQTSNFWARKFKWLVVAANLLIVAPLWVFWFIIKGVIETTKSKRRVSTMSKDYHNIFTSLVDCANVENVFEEGEGVMDDDQLALSPQQSNSMSFVDDGIDKKLEERTDRFMESIFDAITSKDTDEDAELQKYDIKTLEFEDNRDISGDKDEHDHLINPYYKTSIAQLSTVFKGPESITDEVLKVFTLDLSAKQRDIIRNLNLMGWNKYPVLIRHTTSTHSAAIVRAIDDPQLFEGKVVVKHWINEVLKLE